MKASWRGGDLLKFSDHFAERLSLVDTAAREWMGLLAYWITGKSSEFFPGPNRRRYLGADLFEHIRAEALCIKNYAVNP
jgi:hypothetical protein